VVLQGYSGVVTYCKEKWSPVTAEAGIGIKRFDDEGRIMMTDHTSFVLFNCYMPNSGQGADRMTYKLDMHASFVSRCRALIASGRNVIVVGDINIAHTEKDIWNAKLSGPGVTKEERDWMDEFTESFVDTFRQLHPLDIKYTWWETRTNAREGNAGWRIDYCFCNKSFAETNLVDCKILSRIKGSDHCPVVLTIKPQSPPLPHPPIAISSKVLFASV